LGGDPGGEVGIDLGQAFAHTVYEIPGRKVKGSRGEDKFLGRFDAN
jgi:hypothetical protein